jgi:uncharacterized protein
VPQSGQYPSSPPGQPAPPPPAGSYGGSRPWRTGQDDTTWAVLAHLGGVLFSFIPPLIVFLTKGQESGFVRDQAAEALNFQITLVVAYIISVILVIFLVGLLLLLVVPVVALVLGVVAAVRSGRGEAYRYPVNLRLVK